MRIRVRSDMTVGQFQAARLLFNRRWLDRAWQALGWLTAPGLRCWLGWHDPHHAPKGPPFCQRCGSAL